MPIWTLAILFIARRQSEPMIALNTIGLLQAIGDYM